MNNHTATKKPVVYVACSQTTLEATQGKFLGLIPYFQSWGMDASGVVWSEKAADLLKQQGFPFHFVSVKEVRQFDRLEEAKKVEKLLDRPIKPGGPTWGRLLAFDDYLGSISFYEILGLDGGRPDVLVTAITGAESSTPEDEQANLALSRYAKQNNVKVLGLETQNVQNPLRICPQAVDLLLTRTDARKWDLSHVSPTIFRMKAPHRHFCSYLNDEVVQDFLLREQEHIRASGLKPEHRAIFTPFHIYNMELNYETMCNLATIAEDLEAKHFVYLVGTGSAFRRGLEEKDMVIEGGKRWWAGMKNFWVIKEMSTLALCLLSEAVALPYPLATVETSCERWGIPILRLGEERTISNLPKLVSPAEGVSWLLSQ